MITIIPARMTATIQSPFWILNSSTAFFRPLPVLILLALLISIFFISAHSKVDDGNRTLTVEVIEQVWIANPVASLNKKARFRGPCPDTRESEVEAQLGRQGSRCHIVRPAKRREEVV